MKLLLSKFLPLFSSVCHPLITWPRFGVFYDQTWFRHTHTWLSRASRSSSSSSLLPSPSFVLISHPICSFLISSFFSSFSFSLSYFHFHFHLFSSNVASEFPHTLSECVCVCVCVYNLHFCFWWSVELVRMSCGDAVDDAGAKAKVKAEESSILSSFILIFSQSASCKVPSLVPRMVPCNVSQVITKTQVHVSFDFYLALFF